jgi:hypothetical protein
MESNNCNGLVNGHAGINEIGHKPGLLPGIRFRRRGNPYYDKRLPASYRRIAPYLCLLLDFAEGQGYVASDLSGAGIVGTLSGFDFSNCWKDGSLIFDGVNDFVGGSFSSNNWSDEFCIEIWLKTTVQTSRGIVTLADNNTNLYGLTCGSSNTLIVRYDVSGTKKYVVTTDNHLLDDGNAHHLFGMHKRSTNESYVILDKVNRSLLPEADATTSANTPNIFKIGDYPGATHAYFSGSIYKVAIYSKMLSNFDISNIYDYEKIFVS